MKQKHTCDRGCLGKRNIWMGALEAGICGRDKTVSMGSKNYVVCTWWRRNFPGSDRHHKDVSKKKIFLGASAKVVNLWGQGHGKIEPTSGRPRKNQNMRSCKDFN